MDVQPRPYSLPPDKEPRLKTLSEYGFLNTPPEEDFDRLTQLAARLFDVPVSLVTLVGDRVQFPKSGTGVDICETGRELSFCTYSILDDSVLIVPDATKDARFSGDPLVVGPPHLRFYAGAPLKSPLGYNVGALCLIDTKPREDFSENDRKTLGDLAILVVERMKTRRLERVNQDSQRRFQNIAATSPDAMIFTSASGKIIFWNAAAGRLFQYTPAEAIGQNIDIIIPPHIKKVRDLAKQIKERGGVETILNRTIEIIVARKDGSEFPIEFSLATWQEKGYATYGAIIRDITERKAHERELDRIARYDKLTGLPNRMLLLEILRKAIRNKSAATVLIVGVDRFRHVNSTLGRSAADEVLANVSKRIAECARREDTVARFGGDKFAILLPNMADPCELDRICADVLSSVEKPMQIGGEQINVGASIGISIAPAHGDDADDLTAHAELALHQAKADGGHTRRIFLPGLHEAALAHRSTEAQLRDAVANHELELFYQPQVRLPDASVVGAEALLRWNHPQRGLLSPAAFMAVLEKEPAGCDRWRVDDQDGVQTARSLAKAEHHGYAY